MLKILLEIIIYMFMKTYVYYNTFAAPHGYIGNYIIDNDKINLNKIYTYGSGTGLYPANKNITISIDEDNNISMLNTQNETITLEK